MKSSFSFVNNLELEIIFEKVLAVLAAVTEVIKTQGGSETETEYFAALVSCTPTPTTPPSLSLSLSLSHHFLVLHVLSCSLQMTALETTESEESVSAVTYLLSLVLKRSVLIIWKAKRLRILSL